MAKEETASPRQYTVDYHLVAVIYFSHNTPRAEDIGRAWLSLASLGAYRARVHIFRRGDTKSIHNKVVRIGASEYLDLLVQEQEKLISFAASSVRTNAKNAILDSDINFDFATSKTWHGNEMPAMLCLSISAQVVADVGTEAILGLLRSLFEVCDSYSPICGLVDIAQPTDAAAGMVYGTTFPGNASVARWVEQINWSFSGRKGATGSEEYIGVTTSVTMSSSGLVEKNDLSA